MRHHALPSPRRRGLAGTIAATLVAAPLAFAVPANADVATKISSFPYSQDWSNAALITANDNWSGVTGVQGYLGQDITTAAAADPRTLLGESAAANDTDVVANATATANNGGVVEVDGDTIAIQGSGTADAPYVAFHLDLTGRTDVSFAFNARDLDASADDAIQQVAVQYRVGAAGSYTNVPGGYIADATTAGSASQVTAMDLDLPVAVDNQASVFVRVMTTNAVGNDELVGIDDIVISATEGDSPLTVVDPGAQSSTVGTPINALTITAGGGTPPYDVSVTNLPAGLSFDAATDQVTGTPTAAGTSEVEVSVTDADAATADATFTWTVTEPDAPVAIDQVQGTGAVSPMLGDTVTTRGIVTAAYPAGGFFGFYIQTPGTGAANIDLATHTASDAVFVRQPTGAVTAAVGSYVEVEGTVTEFAGATQIEVAPADITVLTETVAPVVTTTTATWPASAAQKESLEGMRYRPTGDFTVSNTFSTNNFGEVGLAQGTKPLIQRTEVELPGPAGSSTVEADNAARGVILDDGASTNFLATGNAAACAPLPSGCLINGNLTPPYISTTDPVRVGAKANFTKDVIFTEGGAPASPTYRFQPLETVVGPGNAASPATFENTRTAAPDEDLLNETGEADIKVASFNVLNYFTTLGDANDDNTGDGTCTAFNDRAGDGNTVRGGCDQRGAWDPQDFERQQSKIVDAINALDADVVGLMEIENSASLGEEADEATEALVTALNDDAGSEVWAANPSSTELPASGMDVITNAIIYKPATVDRVGPSRALGTLSDAGEAFNNAREPLGQVFEADAGGEPFLVVVNHFKSKGSAGPNPGDADSGDGQGSSNGSRMLQATALADWVADVQTDAGVDSVVLAGDFNSYAMEDPMRILYDAGYTNVEQYFENGEFSYSFSGLSGSLDHILVNDAALDRSTGTDIWNINAGESLALEYSRFNYHGTDFHAAGPYRSSDHDPVLLGLTADDAAPATTDVQIIGTNDYHGRLAAGPRLAAAVKAARAENPNTVFAAAGDLIGATTFESFIQRDKPTIDVMNEAGLEVSAVGNHEFDKGYDDLVDRVMKAYDPVTNPQGGAEWKYLGANVKFKADDSPALDGTWIRDFGPVEVGFIGAVTEDLPSLVGGDGIADIEVTSVVDATNAAAAELETAGADVVVLLVHEGASSVSLASATNPDSTFGAIVNGVGPKVDAIVSGHTHLAYNHSIPVPAWVTEGRAVTERPVVSAGQYGENLNKLVFTLDNATGEVQTKTQEIITTAQFPATGDAATQAIVTAANNEAAVLGARPLGKIEGGFSKAKFDNGTTDNRGGESTLGNLVAEVQRWATDADIAFMNPGGLRADMMGTGTDYPRTVTYKNAADVQSFANTLVTMDMTGATIKKVLEQQWQRTSGGAVPSRPFLKLGVSEGFSYTYDPARPEGSRITDIRLNGEEVLATDTFKVTANSFLSTGTGDNFHAFGEGTNKRDSGKVDLETMVDYMAAFATDADPLAVDYAQRAVGVAGLAPSYAVGEQVTVNLTSLSMTAPTDVRDTVLQGVFDGRSIGEFPVTTVIPPAADGNSTDEVGTATVSFRVPALDAGGVYNLVLSGEATGTSVTVPITVHAPTKVDATVTATATPSSVQAQTGTATIKVEVASATGTPTGLVAALVDGKVVGGGELVDGKADVMVGPFQAAGTKAITVQYYGDAATKAAEGSTSLTVTPAPVVERAEAKVTTTVSPASVVVNDGTATVSVTVSKASGVPTGAVLALVDGKVVGAGELVAGKADISLAPFSTVGTKSVQVKYFGDDTTKAASTTTSVEVVKATPRMRVKAPKKVAKGKKATIVVTVGATGFTPGGTVTVRVKGKKVIKTLKAGQTTVKIRLTKLGKNKVRITYTGDDMTLSASKTRKIRVTRR